MTGGSFLQLRDKMKCSCSLDKLIYLGTALEMQCLPDLCMA